jgi:hypothetical protein
MSEELPSELSESAFRAHVRAFFTELRAAQAAMTDEGGALVHVRPIEEAKETRRTFMGWFGEQIDKKMFVSPNPQFDEKPHWPVLVTEDVAQWPKTVRSEGANPTWITFAHFTSLRRSATIGFTDESIPLEMLPQITKLVEELTVHGPLAVEQCTAFLEEVVRFQLTMILPPTQSKS